MDLGEGVSGPSLEKVSTSLAGQGSQNSGKNLEKGPKSLQKTHFSEFFITFRAFIETFFGLLGPDFFETLAPEPQNYPFANPRFKKNEKNGYPSCPRFFPLHPLLSTFFPPSFSLFPPFVPPSFSLMYPLLLLLPPSRSPSFPLLSPTLVPTPCCGILTCYGWRAHTHTQSQLFFAHPFLFLPVHPTPPQAIFFPKIPS